MSDGVLRIKQEGHDSANVYRLGLGNNAGGRPQAVPPPKNKHDTKCTRKRLYLEAVVVPTWKDVVEERKRAGIKPDSIDNKAKIKQELLKGIKNPKVKIKAGMALSDDTLFDRITRMNCERIEPPVSQEIRDIAVSREFLSWLYGGNPQETMPKIGKEFLARHGLNDFMYPSLDHNPAAPQIPGAPGLLFGVIGNEKAWEWPGVQRVITRIAAKRWQYVGQYKLTPTEPMTTREWSEQSELFRNTWSREILFRGWGQGVLGRIAARRRFKCLHPTQEQLEAVEQSGEYKNVTAEDVKAAFSRGDEKFAIWEMRYVEYDVDFQQNVAEHWKTWAPPPRKVRKIKNEKQSTIKKARARKTRKRKHSEISDSDAVVPLDPNDDSDSDYLSSS